jgi:hypothetical protein
VDFLKIDVEGYEGHVLFGASDLIQQYRPRLFVEIHPRLLDPAYAITEIEQFLKRSYRSVTYHADRNEGRWTRVVGAYTGNARYAQERDMASVLQSVKNGSYKDIFWATCSND